MFTKQLIEISFYWTNPEHRQNKIMKFFSKLIILYPLFLFSIMNLISGETCKPNNCPISANNSAYVSVRYPFYLKEMQHQSCGRLGFELHCDSTLGTLIQLRNNTVFKVDAINYDNKQIILSDPNDCLPKSLTFPDSIRTTPFYSAGFSKNYWLYKCSYHLIYDNYDRIDCLSGSGYTVVSSSRTTSRITGDCSFLKMMTIPIPKSQYYSNANIHLSSISRIHLTWTAPKEVVRYSISVGWIVGLLAMLVAVLLALYCCCRRLCKRRTQHATATINITNTITSTPTDVRGLDQVTIDSYPIVVVGESGRLIKPDDDACPICLSDYQPRETLKMLPGCLHRFHSDCIDQWLLCNSNCPICRTPPPGKSSDH